MGRKGTQYSSVHRWRAQPVTPVLPEERREMPTTDNFVDDGRLTKARREASAVRELPRPASDHPLGDGTGA